MELLERYDYKIISGLIRVHTVKDIYHQTISWFCAFDGDRARQVVYLGKINVPNIITA